jgi:enoyl-CoA hydratase
MDRAPSDCWPDAVPPTLDRPLPKRMAALQIYRDRYGPPSQALALAEIATPALHAEDAGRVLVSVLATGPNFNTNFASLGLPVPVFGRGDSAAVHIPGSDALGVVVAAGPGVRALKVGQAVILDSWTGRNIRGYETHDGFNAQFVKIEEERALPVPAELKGAAPEQFAAMLLTYGTAYRAVAERLDVRPGESVLLMGGGKGTSFAGAQIVKALGGRVLLMGSNPDLAESLIRRGIADAFVDRRRIPTEVFGPVPPGENPDAWHARTEPFRRAVFDANGGRPVDKIFEHTGGRNFPLLVSALADPGRIAFFGATGGGLKGEYQETFLYAGRRFVFDARWVWMRQKQIFFSRRSAADLLAEIRLPAGRRVLVWGADEGALDFVRAARARRCEVAVIASHRRDAGGIEELSRLGVPRSAVIDRDRFDLPEDMPDPLTDDGRPNPGYGSGYMDTARALGKAVWDVFGPRVSPDVVAERTDQSTLHFSTFLLRDFVEADDMPCAYVLARGPAELAVLGSHMYRSSQAREVLRLLAQGTLVMEPGDIEVVRLADLPQIQQKMLDGRMAKPKGVALVQADAPGRDIRSYEEGYLGEALVRPDLAAGRPIGVHVCNGVGLFTFSREQALNALNQELLTQLAELVGELRKRRSLAGRPVRALILRGAGRAFVAGADVTEFRGSSAERIREIALVNIRLFAEIENLKIPVVALLDGFALGGGNELAMSTHHRIVTENALIGQPEVKLGIIPGYGGMQRLPRLVGPALAAELSINGEAISGRAALQIGLADEFAPSATALAAAFQAAQAFAAGRRKLVRREWDAIAERQQTQLKRLLARPDLAPLRRAPAPDPAAARDIGAARRYAARYVLAAMEQGYRSGFARGLKKDAQLFGDIAASPSGQEWIGRFIEKDPRQSSFLEIFRS